MVAGSAPILIEMPWLFLHHMYIYIYIYIYIYFVCEAVPDSLLSYEDSLLLLDDEFSVMHNC